MEKKINKKRNAMVGAVVLLALVAITLAIVELPKLILSANDNKTASVTTEEEYNVEIVNEPMDFKQKVAALADEDALIVRDETPISVEQKEEAKNILFNELDQLTVGTINSLIKDALNTGVSNKYAEYQIMKPEGEVIYSYRLGVYTLSSNCVYYPGIIMFDLETNKILWANITINTEEVISKYGENSFDFSYDSYKLTTDDETQMRDLMDNYFKGLVENNYSWSDPYTYIINLNNPGKEFTEGFRSIITDCEDMVVK